VLADRLADGEVLRAVAAASSGSRDGVLAVTGTRVVFVERGLVRSHVEEWPLGRVSSVEATTRMRRGSLVVHVSGHSTEFVDVAPRAAVDRIAALVREGAGV